MSDHGDTGRWQFWIDRGGTFTDVVAQDPDGRIHIRKLLSENPRHYDDAPLQAIRDLLGVAKDEPIPGERIGTVKMGTTLATNALLERKGVPVVLVITQGFGDLLDIGYQDRPDLFALHIEKPGALAARVVEAKERIGADGEVITPLDEAALRADLEAARRDGIETAAVLFLHSYANAEHEEAAGRIAREAGMTHVSLSHAVANEIKAVGRGDTTVADAYLTPILRGYVGRLRAALGDGVRLRFMQSNGGLTDAERFSGKNAILSGPAGGVVAYAHACRLAGLGKVIGFDMGGTSTDVSRFDGRYERVYETRTAGVRIKAPMMHIETVAAGGGSILQFDGHRFTVGPESAGAFPGPACYGNGGPAAVTDANLVLGRIQPRWFPACFGPKADQPLNANAALARLDALAEHVAEETGRVQTVEEVAAGFIRIANENMVKPIKEISVARGYDVQEHALCCFGGAAAQHACAIASSLGIRTVLLHPHAGVLSAYGMGLADLIQTAGEAVLETLDDATFARLEERFQILETANMETLREEGFAKNAITHVRSLDLRYLGVESSINVAIEPDGDVRAAFETAHEGLYGFTKPGHAIEAVNLRVESIGHTEKPSEPELPLQPRTLTESGAEDVACVHFDVLDDDGRRVLRKTPTPVFLRSRLRPGDTVMGPAILIEDVSTIVVDPGWRATLNGRGHVLLEAYEVQGARERVAETCDPVLLEVFNNLFMSVADQMGKTLERVAHSANIKERLDFSCAVFGPDGALVANAPHIPVHLGAMGESVRAILSDRGDAMKPGDAYVTNDPYRGGSHLPDVTVVTPVFAPSGERIFFVASRGHHADIGGITPGSMPPFSKSIEEEGVVLHDFLLLSDGRFREDAIVEALRAGPYPARNIPERLSDLRAQVAANVRGANLLSGLCDAYGVAAVQAYMRHVRANAAETMRDRIRALPDGVHVFTQYLDDGTPIVCRINIDGDTAALDFTGTGPQSPGNLNAPPAVVLSAVLYVFRTLVGTRIPLNEGCLDPITVRIPEGTLLRPRPPAAVVGGNVETSQRVCDVVYGALGVLAGSQGTMNNFSFGTTEFGYYETICGGAGAGNGFDGASAVHTHMTNTRITDPEVLERRYPVRLRTFAIRRGSGGAGKYHGGDGVVRTIEFLAPMSVTLLTERRETQPYGLHGGEPGAPGINHLTRACGTEETLPGHAALDVVPGDILTIETPGGGGYGGE